MPALFVQDDLKVSHNLTLNLGLRYEYYSPLVDVHNHQDNFNYATGQLEVAPGAGGVDGCTVCVLGKSNALSTWQKANFAPRIGFAYTPFKDTVIRGAFGIFYSGQEVRTGEPTQLQYNLPFYYQPTFESDGINPLITFATGFPPLNPAQAINPGVTSLDTYVKTPYLQEWNVAVQRVLPGKMSLEVAYVGTKAVHLEGVSDQNQVMVPGPGDVQSRRPYPFFGPFTSLQNRGNSWYNSLQVKLEKKLSHGLYFLSSFTFAKALNDFPTINDGLSVDNSYNLKAYKQPANFSRPLSWVTSFDYLLPFGKGTALLNKSKALDLIVGGWHMTGILTLTHGGVFTPTMSYDSSNTGTGGITLPDRLRNGALSGSQRTLNEWFDITAFVDAQQYTFGNSGYGVLYGPGLINMDFGLRKIFDITERQKLQLRAEAFNALNHPYFSNPDAGIDDGPGAAGAITSTQGSNRVVQIGLKYQF